jgi:signal transduction histidine kinase
MKNPRQVWLLFACTAIVVYAALAWVSSEVVRLEAEKRAARHAARLEENVRLALWRMDSRAAQSLAGFAWSGASPSTDGVGGPPEYTAQGGPSRSFVQYNFLVDPQNNFFTGAGTPVPQEGSQLPPRQEQVLSGMSDLQIERPEGEEVERSQVAVQTEQLQQFSYGSIASNLRPKQPQPEEVMDTERLQKMRYSDTPAAQKMVSRKEFQARSMTNSLQNSLQNPLPPTTPARAVPASPMQAMWLGDELVLARRLDTPEGELLEGAVLDWPALRRDLLGEIREDLLPDARLLPLRDDDSADPARRMAALPLRLVPGEAPVPARAGPGRAVSVVLGAAWAAVLLATALAGVSLHGVLQLSERRADFVSAVTHELRTPLTTFRMYTEMLAGGMVENEQKRERYLGTLKTEADRLGHLVENVLSYAQLERSNTDRRVQTLPLGQALDRMLPRLEDRTAQAEMELCAALDDPARACSVRIDPEALEHIVINLVDNACKYAARAEDARLKLSAQVERRHVCLRLRDHGPGVPSEDRRRVFKPFRKSARRAAQTAPGVGLGLALSRRMARAMGGDLELDPECEAGACFVLTLPRA